MKTDLKYYEQFKQVLQNYKVSEQAQKSLEGLELVLLLAPTSAGRNTLIRELLKTGEYYYIVSDTTREPRINDGIPEQDGVEYWFRSEKEVLEDLRAGKYLEAELIHQQQVSGISIRELLAAREEKKIAITDIDLQGAQTIVQAKPDTHTLIVLPPSFSEWQRRIRQRGKMSSIEYRRRMETALEIFGFALGHEYFAFIINDRIGHAVQQVHDIAKAGQGGQQQSGRQLAEQLYKETKQFLESSA